jgi:hypothetical protein
LFNFCFVRASARAVFVIVLKINDCLAVGWLERWSATYETRLLLFFWNLGVGGKGGWRAGGRRDFEFLEKRERQNKERERER